MEELKKLIKKRIVDQKEDILTKNKDGSINQSELDWYSNICLERLIDIAIKSGFDG